MSYLFSGSSAGRAAACAASCVLPRAESSGDAAETGHVVHAYLARVAVSPADKTLALAAVPQEHRARCAAVDVASVLDGLSAVVAEAAYAYDVATGEARLLGVNIERQYGDLGPNEIPCTPDVIAMRGERAVAIDWKSGQDVGAADENWQLRLQALVLRAMSRAEEVEARLVYIDEDGGTRTVSHVFDALDLDGAADELRGILKRVREAESVVAAGKLPVLHEGDHCKYCPVFSMCPAKTTLARALVRDAETMVGSIEAMTPDEQGRAWVKLKAFFAVGKKIEDALKVACAHGPIPLPNGKVLRMVPMPGRASFDKDRAMAMLLELGADQAAVSSLLSEGRPFGKATESKA